MHPWQISSTLLSWYSEEVAQNYRVEKGCLKPKTKPLLWHKIKAWEGLRSEVAWLFALSEVQSSYRNSCGLGYGSLLSITTNLRVVGKSNSCISLHTAWPTFCCQQSLLASAETQELQLFFPCPLCRGQPRWWHQRCSTLVTHSAAMLLEPACPHPSPLPAAFSISRRAPSPLPA